VVVVEQGREEGNEKKSSTFDSSFFRMNIVLKLNPVFFHSSSLPSTFNIPWQSVYLSDQVGAVNGMLKRLKAVTTQKWIVSLPREKAAQILKEQKQQKRKKPVKKKVPTPPKEKEKEKAKKKKIVPIRKIKIKGPTRKEPVVDPLMVTVKGRQRKLEMFEPPPTCLPISSLDDDDCIIDDVTVEKEVVHVFDCLVCASYRGWWCRQCDHYYLGRQLAEVLWMTPTQIERLLQIVKGDHPELIPCFICNRTGLKNLDIVIKGHETSYKYQNFWQTVLFFLLM
jgi:hypothetical protein